MIWAVLLMVVFVQGHAQTKFEKVKSLKGINVTVKVLNPTQVVVVPDAEPNQRYSSVDIPEELKKDGLRLSIDGDVGAIPPNVRMIGTPFRITCIHVTNAERKKYKLSRKSYCIKH